MDIKDKLNAIRALLGLKFEEGMFPETNEGGAETKADLTYENTSMGKDGMEYRYNGELAIGTEVVVVMPEGIEPVADGNHELQDGTIITMAGGKVEAITQAVVTQSDEDMNKEFSAQLEAFKSEVETLKASFAEIKTFNETFSASSTQEFSTLKDSLAKALELIEAINVTPAVTPVAPINNQFSKVESKKAYLNQVSEAIKNLK